MSVRNNKDSGFTIIEVVLVLAIAALIFLMVFIALPALQNSQRDTQRKSDVARVSTQVSNYASANRGKIPGSLITALGASGKSFVQSYLGGAVPTVGGEEYQDPKTGEGYTFLATGGTPTTIGVIGYAPGKVCATDGTGGYVGGSARQYAVSVFLEGQKAPHCVDNR